jgi:rubredoxin
VGARDAIAPLPGMRVARMDVIDMSWTCPACGSEIQHHEERPLPSVVYRCNVCRLEFVVDLRIGQMALAPLPPPSGDVKPKRTV